MMRRSLRILVLLLTVGVTAFVVWRATTNEQARGRMRLASQQTDAAAADAIFELGDLRASLHAYVAPGQGEAFWSQRARMQIASIRARLTELQPASTAANHPLATAFANLDALAAAEQRTREAVGNAQWLVAGDIIFTEARDLIDGAARDLSDARQAMARAASASEAATANEQSLLAGAAIAVWIFALILLVPVPSAPAAMATTSPVPALADSEGLQLREITQPPARSRTKAGGAADATVAAEATAALAAASVPSASPSAPPPPSSSESSPASAVPAASATSAATPVFEALANLCADIGRVSDAGELSPLLARSAEVAGTRGIVVWLLSEDRRQLVPAMAHGYDQKLLARMGAIPVDDHNLTAAAFRTREATRTPPEDETPGAVAVPMLCASGASGVLAAEVPGGADLDQAAAVVGIIAAQLASLFPAPAASGEPPQHAHA